MTCFLRYGAELSSLAMSASTISMVSRCQVSRFQSPPLEVSLDCWFHSLDVNWIIGHRLRRLHVSGISRNELTEIAGHEIAGHENAGHEIARHENAGHEIAGHENAGHEFARHDLYRMKIDYFALECAFLLNLNFLYVRRVC